MKRSVKGSCLFFHSPPLKIKTCPFPNVYCLYLHQLLQETCHVHTNHPNEAPKQQKAMCFKETSSQTCITHKVMFSSIPRETYFKVGWTFFLFQTNVFCLAFKLILLELHLSCLTPLTFASCLQRIRRHSHIHIIWHYGKKKSMQSSGDCYFHNKCLWWHFAVCITWSVRGCLTDTTQIPSRSTHPLLLYVFLSCNTLF